MWAYCDVYNISKVMVICHINNMVGVPVVVCFLAVKFTVEANFVNSHLSFVLVFVQCLYVEIRE